MKKSLLIAAALTAATAAGEASALNSFVPQALMVDGLHGASLGVISFTPLGRNGAFCDYLGNWMSPFNPNDVLLCVVHEALTNFAPSCIVNERINITTVVTAGGADCAGFNLKGEAFIGTSLILSEFPGGLSGLAVVGPAGCGQAYPVTTACAVTCCAAVC